MFAIELTVSCGRINYDSIDAEIPDTSDGGIPDASADGAFAACNDGLENGLETDVDCGGDCAACALGQGCNEAADCATGRCATQTCVASIANVSAADLDGLNGFRLIFTGFDTDDLFGTSVACGDFDADTLADIAIGSADADDNGNGSGQATVLFGKALSSEATVDLAMVSASNRVTVIGSGGFARLGGAIANAGDANNDGIDDFMVFEGNANFGGAEHGASHMLWGRSDWSLGQTVPIASSFQGVSFPYAGTDLLNIAGGQAVNNAGDVNNDGIDDFIFGAELNGGINGFHSGQAFVLFGSAAAWSTPFDTATLDGSNGFVIEGVEPGSNTGYSVGSPGDVDGDGFDDVLVSSDYTGGRGAVHLVFGGSAPIADVDLSVPDSNRTILFFSPTSSAALGSVVLRNGGDLNNDGFDEVIFSDYSFGSNEPGRVYLLFGRSRSAWQSLGAVVDVSTLGSTDGLLTIDGTDKDHLGRSISIVSDMNGDSLPDLVIGAQYWATDMNQPGKVYVLYGRSDWNSFGGNIDLGAGSGVAGFAFNGIEGGERMGRNVEVCDLNGDGLMDMIVSAYLADQNGFVDSGRVYVLYGFEQLPQP